MVEVEDEEAWDEEEEEEAKKRAESIATRAVIAPKGGGGGGGKGVRGRKRAGRRAGRWWQGRGPATHAGAVAVDVAVEGAGVGCCCCWCCGSRGGRRHDAALLEEGTRRTTTHFRARTFKLMCHAYVWCVRACTGLGRVVSVCAGEEWRIAAHEQLSCGN